LIPISNLNSETGFWKISMGFLQIRCFSPKKIPQSPLITAWRFFPYQKALSSRKVLFPLRAHFGTGKSSSWDWEKISEKNLGFGETPSRSLRIRSQNLNSISEITDIKFWKTFHCKIWKYPVSVLFWELKQ